MLATIAVIVNTAGSNFSVNGFAACFVGNAGSGMVALSANTNANTAGVTLANLSGSSGTVSINNATWTNANFFSVGSFGSGVLSMSHGTLSTDSLTFAHEAGSTGVATFAVGSTISNAGTLIVGLLGNATVSIDSASTMTTGTTAVASGAASRGQIDVNTTGSALNVNGLLTVASSSGSNGTVNITNGASMNTLGALVAGQSVGSTGTVNLSGAGSNWNCTGALHVAYYDTSTQKLMYAVKPNGGSWSTPVSITNATGVGTYVSMAVDSTNGVGVVYADETNADLLYAYKPAGGGYSSN